jgi:hypothetical protein
MTLYVTGGSDRYDRCLWPPWDYGPDFRIIPPTCVVHRRSVTDHIGGWRHYRELDWYPDLELWLRAYTANYRFACVSRLTAIKFPAVARRDVYKMRPCHEQAAWSQSIQNEDNFEIAELIRTIRAMAVQGRLQPIEFTKISSMAPYRVLVHDFLQETRKRLMWRGRRLISRPLRSKANAVEVAREPKGKVIDTAREFKGLHRMP